MVSCVFLMLIVQGNNCTSKWSLGSIALWIEMAPNFPSCSWYAEE
ncbi:hypothetical protein AVEN_198987-1, partial [Araneus ventricosus]